MIWRTRHPQWGGGWCLWLEAEAELAALRAGRDWRSVPEAPAAVRRGAARALLGDESSQVSEERNGATRLGFGGAGFAWSPTPHAIELLEGRGLTPPRAPDWRALCSANARESFVGMAPLPGSATCHSVADVLAALDAPSLTRPSGNRPAWILRASLCAAGQDRLVAEGPCDLAANFAERRLLAGPVDLAPMVDIVEEFAIHGRIGSDGARCAARAVRYSGTSRPGSRQPGVEIAAPDIAASLAHAFEEVGEQLSSMGYFGPVGIDAFTWRDATGSVRLRAVSDVNARYTQFFSMCAPDLFGLDHTS